ncbi:MAG: glycoside hydrolase family 127 protein [Clostridia bacterium]|nr:glycoside hydrolase family 127 protein [Clostridia bacterium]
MPLKPVFPRAPFTRAAFAYLPYTAVTCQGAVADRLNRLIPSLSAMTLTAPVLEALLPAAYLTGKSDTAAKCEEALQQLVANQGPGGDLPGEGWSEKISLCLALMAWYEAKRPEAVLPCLLKFCQHLWDNWESLTSDSPAMAASGEMMQVLSWLYHVTGKKPLLKLMDRLRLDALDWTSHFHTFSVVKPMDRMVPMSDLEADMALENGDIGGFYTRQYYMTHGEYLARSLKTPALFAQVSGSLKEKGAPKAGYQKVMRYHGAANGMFNEEPLLSGGDPAQSCGMANAGEWAVSLGEVYHLQGEGEIADALEQVVYNGLMAGESQGLIQPRQAVNTIEPQAYPYVQPKEAPKALMGLVKGLCALARQQYLALENEGVAVTAYESSKLHWRIRGVNVNLSLTGCYPKTGKMTLAVDCKTPVAFDVKLRIPGWCQDACITVNDEGGEAPKAGEMFTISRTWRKGDQVTIDLPMPLRSQTWYHQTIAAFKGPQLMALDSLKGPWRYALEVGDEVVGYAAPGWDEVKGKPKMPPAAPKAEGEGTVLPMVPYGETQVHMAQFPQVAK